MFIVFIAWSGSTNTHLTSTYVIFGVSEWLLFNANSAIFLAISWREQGNFQWDDDYVCFVLDQQA